MHGLHQGYSYQDLLAAFLISENLHRRDFKIAIELKESTDDAFDDIVFIADGKKTKIQVKHSAANAALNKSSFHNSSSDLNLDKLAKSLKAGIDADYVITTNRKVTTDPFFKEGKNSKIFRLKCKSYSVTDLSRHKKFLQKLAIEASLPEASFDLSKPGSLEKELLGSLRSHVGIGYYPNNQVSERDVAGRLILLASQLRGSKKHEFVTREDIFKNLNLNVEYGHIAQDFPFISTEYRLYRNELVDKLKSLVLKNKYVVLEGPPGSGKSHIFDDLHSQVSSKKIIAARHFCYLEPTDKFAQERIVAETLYGNFLHQLQKAEPEIAEGLRPYFAATKINVEKFLEKLSVIGKGAILMVDGLDHLSRVVAQNKLSPDLVSNFVSELLDLKLPKGSSIFIASQPGNEIKEVIAAKGAKVALVPSWNEKMIEEFIKKHTERLPVERQISLTAETVSLFTQKTEGNALYLTYVLNEILSSGNEKNVPAFLETLPQLSSDLNNYYKYLTHDSDESDFAVIQTLALLDFSVSTDELKEMFPPIQRKALQRTISKIQPILKPGVVHGGLRIYHESFRRFVIEQGHKNKQKDSDLYSHITEWLKKNGFYASQRAYRYLIPYLIRSDKYQEVYFLLKEDFVAQSLYFFHSIESTTNNLNKIAELSAREQRWDIYCKDVELRRALHTYTWERQESVEDVYHQSVLDVLGAEIFCERMLFDGKPVFSKTGGILLCQMVQHKGGNPPWDYYDVAGVSMKVGDASQIRYYQEVESAHFLKLIRSSSLKQALRTLQRMLVRNNHKDTELRQIRFLLREFNHQFGVTKHNKELTSLSVGINKKVPLYIAVAEYLYQEGQKKDAAKFASLAIQSTKNKDYISQALMCGGKPNSLIRLPNLGKLTEQVLEFENLYDKERPVFSEWYKTLLIQARINPGAVHSAKKLVTRIDGWYRAWIKFLFELSLLEASDVTDVEKAHWLEEALTELNKYTHPFAGKPRAMDLYGIREESTDSFRRTIAIAGKLDNYQSVISLLSAISRRTTSYLQGSSDGPLSGETFNSLLKDGYSELSVPKRKVVLKLLRENVLDRAGTSQYYDSSAFEYLKLASVLSLAGNKTEAKKRLFEGCVHATAYGHRKDVTIYEIIEPISFIAKKDLAFAQEALKKLYYLAETVWRYTDGKSTQYSLTYWLEALVDSNFSIAAQAMTELVTKDPKRDWRVERGTNYFCDKLLESNIPKSLIAELYDTINQKQDVDFNVTVGLKIVEALLVDGEKIQADELFARMSHGLYLTLIFDKYVREKENFPKMLNFAKKFGMTIPEDEKLHFEAQLEKKSMELPGGTAAAESKPTPKFKLKGISLENLRRLMDENPLSHFFEAPNEKEFSEALFSIEKQHPRKAQELILSAMRNGYIKDGDIDSLVRLQEFFLKKKQIEIAAFIGVLCFVYARGGNGWHSLADSKYNHLLKNAFKLFKATAKNALATEMSYQFAKQGYYTGPTRHFIEYFSLNSGVKISEKIWNEAFKVIKFRLPTPTELVEVIEKDIPAFGYKSNRSLKVVIKELIAARKAMTD